MLICLFTSSLLINVIVVVLALVLAAVVVQADFGGEGRGAGGAGPAAFLLAVLEDPVVAIGLVDLGLEAYLADNWVTSTDAGLMII